MIGTDGTTEQIEGEEGLEQCEFCGRYYPAIPTLWAGLSGSNVACLHCCFNDAYEDIREMMDRIKAGSSRLADPDLHEGLAENLLFLEELSDQSGRRIGGIRGYVQRCLADHKPESCSWRPNCFLCDCLAAGGDPADPAAIERWLSLLSLQPPPKPIDIRVLKSWLEFDAKEQAVFVAQLAEELDRQWRHHDIRFVAEQEPGGLPCIRTLPYEIDFVIVPAAGRRRKPFLLARTPLTRTQGARLGLLEAPEEANGDLPMTAFDLQVLPKIFSAGPLRLPTASEWAFASGYPLRNVDYVVKGRKRIPADIEGCCWHAANTETVRSVEANASRANELGLVDLVGNVNELVGINEDRLETVGGSFQSHTHELVALFELPQTNKPPTNRQTKVWSWPITSLVDRDAFGRLQSRPVPLHVGLRLAIGLL